MSLLQRVLISRSLQCRRSFITTSLKLSRKQNDSSSSDSESSSDDDERKGKKRVAAKTATQIEATKKLNALLEAMIKEEPSQVVESKLNLAKPREIQRQKHLEEKQTKTENQKFDEKLVGAAKEVAKDIGGDVKQTEAELLTRLLYKAKSIEETSEEAQPKKDGKLKDSQKELGSYTLNELLSGMKIDRSKPKESFPTLESRADQVRTILGQATKRQIPKEGASFKKRLPTPRGEIVGERVNLFDAEPLNIFTRNKQVQSEDEIKLETWDRCFNRELRLATTQPPTNIYEQMILWTNKGMLWHFPIDNEQGLEEEKKYHFYEHVHLERHIEGWCPSTGPIRHFMELVCVGLSKNPWLTVDEKLEHIWWYRDYFSSKANLIKEIGAGDIKIESKAQQL